MATRDREPWLAEGRGGYYSAVGCAGRPVRPGRGLVCGKGFHLEPLVHLAGRSLSAGLPAGILVSPGHRIPGHTRAAGGGQRPGAPPAPHQQARDLALDALPQRRGHCPGHFRRRHPGLPSTATCRVSRIGCSHICAAGHTTEVADLWRPALGSSPTTGLGPAHGAGVCPRWRRQARSTGAPPSSASACSGRRPRQSWRAAPPGWRRSARMRS